MIDNTQYEFLSRGNTRGLSDIILDTLFGVVYSPDRYKNPASVVAEDGAESSKRDKLHAEPKCIVGLPRGTGKRFASRPRWTLGLQIMFEASRRL